MKLNTLKIAFLGISHWHVPLYFPAIPKGAVIAVSDPDAVIAEKYASQFDCRFFVDWEELLAETHPDFVFAFAPHNEMAAIALELIKRGIPFAMEKPAGMSEKELPVYYKAGS